MTRKVAAAPLFAAITYATAFTFAVALTCSAATASAAELPLHLSPDMPFPRILLQAPDVEQIAPGVEYGDYEMWTDVGPLSVHVISVDEQTATDRVGSVLADDALTSPGETVSSMAQRTGAIAGINGDYFDIGATNRPTNLVVRDGQLLQTPRNRYALALLRNGEARFTEFSFSGSVWTGGQTIALGAINVPPSDAQPVSLLTPAFGPVASSQNLTLVALQPTDGMPPLATYRVLDVANEEQQPPGYYLAIATAGYGEQSLPNDGDAITVSGDLAPLPLAQLAAAIGGGPMILQNGQWYDDPDGPRGGEFDQRIPCSGAAIGNGTLFLVEVDGRQPERSVGLTRPEFASLMRALGGWDGIAFDGGGSSTLAVRMLGDPVALLQNSPSDGVERRVSDGIFVYNDAPVGPADRLVGSPGVVRAVPGATVALHLAAIDANDHAADTDAPIFASVEPATLGKILEGNFFVASGTGSGIISLHSGSLRGAIAVHVDTAPTRLLILPPDPNVVAHGDLLLTARAFDSEGFELVLPEHLHWNASNGQIDDRGHWAAGEHDAQVTLEIGGRIAFTRVSVGNHEVPIDVVQGVHFLSVPGGGGGTAQPDTSCDGCIQLDYALGPRERAGYAIVERPLPAGTIGLSFDLRDDGSGAMLRIALRNAINEQVLVTASSLDHPGSRRVVVHFPPGLAQPLHLVGFYAIGTSAEDTRSGSAVIGDVHALVAGSTP